MDKVLDLVRNGLCSNTRVVRVMLLSQRGCAPRLLKIEVPTLEDKISLLEKKQELSRTQIYSNVFIRSSKSHTDRLIEIKTQMILKESKPQRWPKV